MFHSKLEQAARQACQTPLKDLLRSVPKDGRDCYEESSTSHHFIPYGRLIHEALAEIERLEALAEPDIEKMTLTQIAARHEQAEQEPIMRKATRDEKIVRPGVYEVSVEQYPQKPAGIYYGEVEGIGHRMRLDIELPIGSKLYAAPVRTKDLTDDELERVWFSTGNASLANSLRAVIAADREKNK